MRLINVVTTIDVPEKATTEQIYEMFREWITEAHESGDLSVFTFTEANTDEELE